ncbi:very short patch repair endonuclease [Nocardioides sp. SR21]|uniref:very short patch repair endonuclease n=1 Tax=Nocardioides sp. SR21 TaxID=2919501 RepID=UPI0024311EA7|nr:very short patch repair endonuclease [Nocardioides sp. SR21]
MPGEDDPIWIHRGVSDPAYFVPPTAEPPVTPAVRRTMMSNRGRDTGPELALRSLLHRSGLRFRVDHPLPFDRRRRADIVFTRVGLHVFVDGCFWHGCPEHFVLPKTRTEFWSQKIETNRVRDRDTDARLQALGLTSLRIWEHITPVEAAALVAQTYRGCLDADPARHSVG